MAEIRLLGAVEVRASGRTLDAGPPKQRAVLAVLAVHAGEPVSADTLIDRVWGDSPPGRARDALYVQVTRIRGLLGATLGDGQAMGLARRAGGYVLEVPPDDVDLHRFQRLVSRARDPSCDPAKRLELLRQAVSLWRGEPLAGVAGEWAARTRRGLQARRLDAVLAWARAELAAGNPKDLIGPLGAMLADNPLAEPLTAMQMRALVAAGRRAEALELFAATRQRLVDELGVEPGPELRDLHQETLREEPTPSSSSSGTAALRAAPRVVVPRQLPAGVSGFAGRAEHLRRLDELLAAGNGDQPTAVVITAIAGAAGIGKTALAVHWAHRVADQFPDGQLYVNLRGFDPGGAATPPTDAIRGLLGALGVPPVQIPAELDGQAALYRSLLAGKRVLIVLDNARDADQVRPLLPGSPGCQVLITSRDQLASLVATAGARPLTLDVLTAAEARELLSRRLGAAVVAADPDAVDRVITACARLPLALSIAAARAQQAGLSLAGVAADLSAGERRLDALDAGDPASQVRAVFSWSYGALGEPAGPVGPRLRGSQAHSSHPAQRMFRLLGLHPGHDVSAAAAASLAGCPRDEARRWLGELARLSLLSEHTPGRYTLHDLLRAYAGDLCREHDGEPARRAAVTRVLDHYLHTAHAAARLIYPQRDPMPLPLGAAAPGALPEELADYQAAMAWLEAERAVLVSAPGRAALMGAPERGGDAGLDRRAWQLAWSLDAFLLRRGHRHELASVWSAALVAAERLDDPIARATAHRCIGHAVAQLDRYAESHEHHRRALELFGAADDPVGAADTHRNLAVLCDREGDTAQAARHIEHALAGYAAVGHRRGEALALNMAGWYATARGDHAAALDACGRALAVLVELGDRNGQAATCDSLGLAQHQLGRYADAAESYRRSVALCRELGDRHAEATVLTRLGDTQLAAGDRAAARATWQDALGLLVNLEQPEAETVRAKLRDLERQPAAAR
jgi:DNA-binding SARP family transcriptional activator/tetratricopeptide (TPR) repeat protein